MPGLRRNFLLSFSHALPFSAGLSMSSAGACAAVSPTGQATAKRCILIWLDGGPSHLESFDPKPNAPAEVRGPLSSISTAVPGFALNECLTGLAARSDRVTVVRSMTSPLGEHNLGTHYLLSGYQPGGTMQHPAFSAVVQHESSPLSAMPQHVAVPDFRVGGADFRGNGFLPASVRPFEVGADPAEENFQVRDLTSSGALSRQRMQRREDLFQRLAELDSGRHPASSSSRASLERAFALAEDPRVKEAFRLDRESPENRRRYGPRTIGQACLLARRLIQRDVRCITVNMRGWDTHQDLQTRLKDGFSGAKVGVGLLPLLDTAVSALLDDLKDTGLLKSTLVVVMGEFGRTPKINANGGRDHWPRVFSVLLAGGGVPEGAVYGASDRTGESPQDSPVTPASLVSTIYSLFGIPSDRSMTTADGRPIRLTPDGTTPIAELLPAS